ncbi:MAG: copper chaperone PCu(A)C [Sphingosinicella sp.]
MAVKRLVPSLAIALASACGGEPATPQVVPEHVIVTLPALPRGAGAAYFRLTGNVPARLTTIESAGFARADFHQSVEQGGVSRMMALPAPSLSPDMALVFAPGGKHAMLHGMTAGLRPGDRLAVTFRFDGAPSATALAEVRGPGDAAP